jgi:hypothetical protein
VVDLHYHKCPNCSTVWSHADNCYGSKKYHKCPKCKTECFSREHGLSQEDKDRAVQHPRARGAEDYEKYH